MAKFKGEAHIGSNLHTNVRFTVLCTQTEWDFLRNTFEQVHGAAEARALLYHLVGILEGTGGFPHSEDALQEPHLVVTVEANNVR